MRPMLIAALLVTTAATPALSQGAEMDRRIDRVEREIRALQRQVFPGGNADFFEPEIQAGAADAPGAPPAPGPRRSSSNRWAIPETRGGSPCGMPRSDRPHHGSLIFKRGSPSLLGDEVPRQSLELLAGDDRKPFQAGSGRLELAEAIWELLLYKKLFLENCIIKLLTE
mgnify:CR=1 FL=1